MHNQGRKFEIIEEYNLVQRRAEPPSKNAGDVEEPTIQEDAVKSKELDDAKAASAALEAKIKADAEAAAAAQAAAKAEKDKNDEIARNWKPDGTFHRNGGR